MRLRTYLILAAIALFVVSYPTEYYWTGGGAQALDLSDPRVAASMEYLSRDTANGSVVLSKSLIKAWLSRAGSGSRVNVALQAGNYGWLAEVTYDKDGRPTSGSVNLWSGTLFPIFLRNTAFALAGLWLFAFLAPHVAGVKCPFCPPSFLSPPLCDIEEATVYAGGSDFRGDSLAPIVRRDFVCQRCGYRRITYAVPGTYRPGTMFRWISGANLSTMGELDMYQDVLDKWHSRSSHGQFRDQDEWRAFYEELKRSERVIQPGGGGTPS